MLSAIEQLAYGAFKHLKYIYFSDTNITAEQFNELVTRAPHLEEIDMRWNYDLIKKFKYLRLKSLRKLRVIRLGRYDAAPDRLQALQQDLAPIVLEVC